MRETNPPEMIGRYPVDPQLPPRKCAYAGCSVVFKPTSPSAKYHDNDCRHKANNEKRKRRRAK